MKTQITTLALLATGGALFGQGSVIVGWDFSSYGGSGASVIEDTFAPTDVLPGEYSSFDNTGVAIQAGIPSNTFGTVFYDGSFGSTDLNTQGFGDPNNATGELNANDTVGGLFVGQRFNQVGTYAAIDAEYANAGIGAYFGNALVFTNATSSPLTIAVEFDVSNIDPSFSAVEDLGISFAANANDPSSVSVAFGGNTLVAGEALGAAEEVVAANVGDFVGSSSVFLVTLQPGAQIDGLAVTGTPIPEPSAMAGIFGVVALLAARRFRA